MKLLLATANPHKVRELLKLLQNVVAQEEDLELLSLHDFPGVELPPETGVTMRDNARLKALHCVRATGLPSLADDSGIEVDALNGEPGVYSARWIEGSDADRTREVLKRLSGTPEAERTARYRCVICVAWPDGSTSEREATCEGRITHAERDADGFGYDPIFELTPDSGAPAQYIGHTMAEVPPEIKALISHRARAVRAMTEEIANE